MTIASVYPPQSPQDIRSTWSIIWGCLTVMFACTWLSVHPNIPALDDTTNAIFRRRLRLMLIALLAPELILLWALRQWFGARHIVHKIGTHASTQQGFFLLMGGFVDMSRKPIDPRNYPINLFELTQIANEDIADRSKSDLFGKGIAFLQIIWFTIECIVRFKRPGLEITEIEVATLGFAVMSMVSYIIWLHKPLDFRRPVIVTTMYRSPGSSALDQLPEGLDVQPLPRVPGPISSLASFFGDPTYCSHLPSNAMRVPTFYAPPITHNQMLLSYLFAAITGSVFGAIHFLAWSLQFPTNYESHFWRMSLIITASYPIMLFLYIWLVSRWDEDTFGDAPSTSIWKSIVDGSVMLGLFIYVTSRLVLIALSCTTLRRLPVGSERMTGWVMQIPHL